jgi:cyclopropane fatty-acyl-phospholipid synthase-like methyltransferase
LTAEASLDKPNAPSCERNREPILTVLRRHFADRTEVLEIGSGTGQHAVFFAAELPHATWQASDRAANLAGIRVWLDEAALGNTPAPVEFDIEATWPRRRYDAVFSANTLHIMPWSAVERLFAGLPDILTDDAKLVIYGPFNYGGDFTSASNAVFDAWLKEAAPHQGIRDFEAVNDLAARAGLVLIEDRAMPSNNRCLVWQRPA